MEHESIYEIILKTQCHAYNQILYLLDRISRCDDGLIFEVAKDTPSVQRISDFTNHKSDLIAEIDRLSKMIADNQIKLIGAMSLVVNAESHPLLERLRTLQDMVNRKIDHIVLEEDRENTALCHSLEQYRERLQLDYEISKIPKEKRKYFVYDPRG